MANWIRNTWNSLWRETPLSPGDGNLTTNPDGYFIPLGYRNTSFCDLSTNLACAAAVQKCVPLAAILLEGAEAFSNGCFEVLNRSTQNYTRGKYKEWDDLLDRPNAFQNKMEFLQMLYIYKRMAGYCYAIPVYPSGLKDRPASLFLLPPWCIDVELKDPKRPMYTYKRGEAMRRVFFTANGNITELKEEDLILFTDNSLALDEDTLLPQSVLRTMTGPISLFTSSEEAGITLVQKHGPMGIISNAMQDVLGSVQNPLDKKELQQDLKQYGLTREHWQYIITNQNLQWIPIGVNIGELRLDENELKSIKAMCFALGYPFILSPFSDQSTYNNVQEAEKRWYQNSVIPQANSIVEQLNTGLKTAASNIEITVTFEDLYVFQQSEEERGKGRKAMGDAVINEYKNNIITLNRALELLKEDTVENGDYYFRDSPENQQAMDMQKLRFSNRNNQGNGQEAAAQS